MAKKHEDLAMDKKGNMDVVTLRRLDCDDLVQRKVGNSPYTTFDD